MTAKSLFTRTVIVFAALAAAGIVVAISSQFVMTPLDQTIMVGLGSAMFGASLCFFLVKLFSLVEK
jgi:hypothetical protein